MKRILACCGALLASASVACAAGRPVNLSGSWALDLGRSQGVPPVIERQIMTVSPVGSRLKVENRYVTNGKSPSISAGTSTLDDALAPNAGEVEFTWKRLNGQEGVGKRTAEWSPAGDTLRVRQEALFDGPQGPVTWQSVQRWWLSKDGALLTVRADVKILPFTQQIVTSVFKRL